nr:DsrE family protein [Pelomonas sp. P8]
MITHGLDHELSSAAFVIALGGMTAGLNVSIFLVSSGVDIVRRGAADLAHVKPIDPLSDMVRDFLQRGGKLWACAVCAKNRGYTQEALIDGAVVAGASVMHELIKNGAATLSF